jgi:hypothetical protein
MLRKTFNDKWWDLWRQYKTRFWASAYAKKHPGVWCVIEMDKSLVSAKEKRDLGHWLVGRADEFLFYHSRFSDFEEKWPVFEWWENGVCLKTWEGGCCFSINHPNQKEWEEALDSLVLRYEGGEIEVKKDIESLCGRIVLACLSLN